MDCSQKSLKNATLWQLEAICAMTGHWRSSQTYDEAIIAIQKSHGNGMVICNSIPFFFHENETKTSEKYCEEIYILYEKLRLVQSALENRCRPLFLNHNERLYIVQINIQLSEIWNFVPLTIITWLFSNRFSLLLESGALPQKSRFHRICNYQNGFQGLHWF